MMAGTRSSPAGRNTSALRRAPSRIGTSTSFSTTMSGVRLARADSIFMRGTFGSIVRQLNLHVGGELLPVGHFRGVPCPRLVDGGAGHRLDHLLAERGLNAFRAERLHRGL